MVSLNDLISTEKELYRKKVKHIGKKRTAAYIFAAAAVIIIGAVVIYDALSRTDTYETASVAMGSVLSVKIYGDNGEEAAEEIIERAQSTETQYISRYKETSEIYALNENGTGDLSDFTAEIISKALEISENSGGAFDITIGNLSSLWDFDNEKNTVPSEDEITEALEGCGYEKITLSGNTCTLGENQTVDLGAVGKGAACDAAAEVLSGYEIDGAVISAGGTVLVYGENPDNEYWTVGIRTPEKDREDNFATLTVSGTAYISTSGSYEKSFEEDGVLYHHILSPETGMPAQSGLLSVTVVSGGGLVSDALSTACFVLGYESSAALLDMYNAFGIFVTEDKEVLTYGDMTCVFEITDDEYVYGD